IGLKANLRREEGAGKAPSSSRKGWEPSAPSKQNCWVGALLIEGRGLAPTRYLWLALGGGFLPPWGGAWGGGGGGPGGGVVLCWVRAWGRTEVGGLLSVRTGGISAPGPGEKAAPLLTSPTPYRPTTQGGRHHRPLRTHIHKADPANLL